MQVPVGEERPIGKENISLIVLWPNLARAAWAPCRAFSRLQHRKLPLASDLIANKVISVNGNRVNESDLGKDWETSFENFADFSKDYIGAYREPDQMIEK